MVGWPGVGKYTAAKELARIGSADHHHLVVDSHYVNNVIFTLIGADGTKPLPAGVWDRVAGVRQAVMETMRSLSPPEWSFIFTNVLTADNPEDAVLFDDVASLAAARESCFVPVTMICELEELAGRMTTPSRAERLKWTDPDGLRSIVSQRQLLAIDHPNHLCLDVTELSVAESVSRIADHVRLVSASA